MSKPVVVNELFDRLRDLLSLEWVYRDEDTDVSDGSAVSQPSLQQSVEIETLPAALSLLTADMQQSLEQAAMHCDINMINTLIQTMRADHPGLADALAALAADFDYRAILTSLRQHE